MTYIDRLHDAIIRKQTPACVGLDPRWDLLPDVIRSRASEQASCHARAMAVAYEEFCYRIIDVIAPLVPVVKPQAAFFEACGPAGSQTLHNVIHHARKSGLLVICDAKRGDIGSTAQAYAEGYLAGDDATAAPWGADALTINPYMGADTLQPFVDVATARNAGLYILVRTSNPGSGIYQDRQTDGERLYEAVAATVEGLAAQSADGAAYGSIGAVVGATYPDELASLRAAMPHVPFLVPGYGSQGGTAADVGAAFTADGLGAVVNSSRGIIFAHRKDEYAHEFGEVRWEDAVAAATRAMIADLAEHTPAGALNRSDG